MIAQTLDVIETGELPVLDFVAPMPGFPAQRRFVLVQMDEAGVLYSLTSIDAPELRFLVVPPAPFFADYAVDVDDESLVALGLPDAEDLLVLLVLTAGETPAETTANLMAPIVVAQSSRRAVQLVLGGSGLPVRAPLLVG
ncbi:MAG: flagellar assembly protein FliW [Actinobacteria bacterium 13_2_20CM_2_72_6]|nr:MAG: flagellar assembly protein FliW [Actinobacteria bacterium 13_2_20CM_2_72_6]